MKSFLLDNPTYHYFDTLTSFPEKQAYKLILEGYLKFATDIPLQNPLTENSLMKVRRMIMHDRPDIFWVGATVRYKQTAGTQNVVSIQPEYRCTYAEAQQIAQSIQNSPLSRQMNSIFSDYRKNKFEQVLAAYESLIRYAEYDTQAQQSDSTRFPAAYQMDGVVINRKGVCASYSKAFQYYMNTYHVDCWSVSGATSRGRHAWNIVVLDGEPYYVDTTWGDPVFSGSVKDPDYVSYDYFCFTTEQMRRSHGATLDEPQPLCTATKYNYDRYFGLLADSYEMIDVAARIQLAKERGLAEMKVKYTTKSAYDTAVYMLFEKSEIHRILELLKANGVSVSLGTVRYCRDDERYCLTIEI